MDFSPEGFPEFFDSAPVVRVRDPLAAFLGAARDGVLEYRYADAVKLAGHSCPTVASAFLMSGLHSLRCTGRNCRSAAACASK